MPPDPRAQGRYRARPRRARAGPHTTHSPRTGDPRRSRPRGGMTAAAVPLHKGRGRGGRAAATRGPGRRPTQHTQAIPHAPHPPQRRCRRGRASP
eukprot:2570080-Pleurochrysis_carterae.AAC.1